MKKRKGVALVTVIIVFMVVFVLVTTISVLYLNSVKQNVNKKDTDQDSYTALSGLSVMVSYIVENNDTFTSKYPASFSSDSNGYYLDIPIKDSSASYNFTDRVYVEVVTESATVKKYKLTSELLNGESNAKASVTITKDTTRGIVYSQSNYKYE